MSVSIDEKERHILEHSLGILESEIHTWREEAVMLRKCADGVTENLMAPGLKAT